MKCVAPSDSMNPRDRIAAAREQIANAEMAISAVRQPLAIWSFEFDSPFGFRISSFTFYLIATSFPAAAAR